MAVVTPFGHVIPRPDSRGSHGRDLIIVLWVFTAVTLLFVSLRAFAAIRRRKVALDDWIMFLAMVCFIGWSICATLMAAKGGVGHAYYIYKEGEQVVAEVIKLNWTTQVWGIAGVSFAKVSVAFLILRILGVAASKKHKIALYTIIALTGVIDTLAALFTFVQCNPPEKLWHPDLPGTCWNPKVMADYAVFTGVFNGVVDIGLALFPAAAIFVKLEAPKRTKIELCALFSGGIFAGICSLIKSRQLLALSSRYDFSWATYPIFIWVTLELFLVISLGSVPSLRQLKPRTRSFSVGAAYVSPQPDRRPGAPDDYWLNTEGVPMETQTMEEKPSLDFGSSSSASGPIKFGESHSEEVEDSSSSSTEDGRAFSRG